MSALDRGIRVNSQSTEILLNNRLFETPLGSLLFTTRVSPPLAGEVGKTHALLQGGDGSYIKVNIIYGPNTFQFEVAANTGSTSISGPVSVSPAIPYNQEVTLGAVYNSSSGLLSSSVRVVGGTIQASDQAAGGPPTLAWTNSAIRTLPSQADSALSIGLRQFNGFVGKLATYDKAFDLAKPDFNNYVNNPLIWPAQGRLHLLDSTQILGVSSVNTTVPETQTLTFGNALATGLITIGGIEVLVQRGDSGAVVAEKVRTALNSNNIFNKQGEKQKITVEETALTAGTITVDGANVIVATTDATSDIAQKIFDALKAKYYPTSGAGQPNRIVEFNTKDSSVTVTFDPSETSNGNVPPIAISIAATGVALSVDTILQSSQSSPGRVLARTDNALSITFKPQDEDVTNFSAGNSHPKFTLNSGSTGVSIVVSESPASVPSIFSFNTLPQGKVQKIQITNGSTDPASGAPAATPKVAQITTEGDALHVVIEAGAGSIKDALAAAVANAITAFRLNSDGTEKPNLKVASAQVDPTDGTSVLVRFTPGAKDKAHVLVFKGAGSPAEATVQNVSAFAQGARGEIQEVTFLSGGTGAFKLDGETVTPTFTAPATQATAKQVADAAKLALEKKDVAAEVKVLQFTNPTPTTAAGEIVIAGIRIPVATNLAKEALASAVSVYFTAAGDNSSNLAKSPFSKVELSGDKVTFTYKTTVAHPSDQSLLNTGLFPLPTGATATVLTTDPAAKKYSAGYATSAIQTITFKSLDPGPVALQFDVDDPTSTTTPPAKLTHTFTLAGLGPFTAEVIAAQAAGSLQGQIGSNVTNSFGKALSAVVPDGDSVHFVFKNSVTPSATKPIPTISVKGGVASPPLSFTGILGFDSPPPAPTLTGAEEIAFWASRKFDAQTFRFYDAAGRHKLSVSDAGVLTIEFSPSEGDVKPVIFDQLSSTVTASVSTQRPALVEPASVSGYSGGGGNGTSANVLYTQLKTAGAATSETKSLAVDVFIDRSKVVAGATDFGPGVESVSFTLTYDPVLMSDADPTVVIPSGASGSSVFNINRAAGEITFSLTRNESLTDLSKPIATVTFSQKKVANSFPKAIDFGFKSVDIDGINFTGNSFNAAFSSRVQVDRWDIESTLVNALDTAKPVAGQVVAFYGNPSPVQGQQLSLKFQTISNPANAPVSTSASKVVTLSVDTNASTTNTASFTITLPSNVTAASFTPAQGVTATSTKAGRSLEVTVSNAGSKPQGSSLGTITAEVQQATNLTHEFGFAPGSVRVNTVAPAPGGDGQPVYLGFTITDSQGKWKASDMTLGSFNKVAFPTAAVPALDKIITAADALDILRLSAGFEPAWISGTTRPALFVAADIDGSGNITAADALAALRIAAGVSTNATTGWKFIDSATQGLGVSNARPANLNQNMSVSGTVASQNIDSMNPDFQIKAVFVGNVTQPVSNEYLVS